MTPEQFAKSHLASSTPAEGKIEIDVAAMPECKMISFFKMMQREVLRFRLEHPEECAAMAAENAARGGESA